MSNQRIQNRLDPLLGGEIKVILLPRNEDVLGFILAGGIGYVLGKESSTEWKPIMDQFRDRFKQIDRSKIPLPWASLRHSPTIQSIFRQSIYCYLFGLPDACISALCEVLELALARKFEDFEGKKTPVDHELSKLLDWAQISLKEDTEAHSINFIRSIIRSHKLVQDQECLEAIKQVAMILEKLYPSQDIIINVACHYCKQAASTQISLDEGYLANKITLKCDKCGQIYHWMIVP